MLLLASSPRQSGLVENLGTLKADGASWRLFPWEQIRPGLDVKLFSEGNPATSFYHWYYQRAQASGNSSGLTIKAMTTCTQSLRLSPIVPELALVCCCSERASVNCSDAPEGVAQLKLTHALPRYNPGQHVVGSSSYVHGPVSLPIKEPMQQMYFVVLLPNGTVVMPKVAPWCITLTKSSHLGSQLQQIERSVKDVMKRSWRDAFELFEW
jgi:hypothetical protein